MAAMGRIDRAERLIRADASRMFSCWTDAAMLVHWLPPDGMSARLTHFEPRSGGPFRLVLGHQDPALAGPCGGEAVIAGQFTTIDPPRHLAFHSRFRSENPDYSGIMRTDWEFISEPRATLVRVSAHNVPPGIDARAHEEVLNASLAQLAALVE